MIHEIQGDAVHLLEIGLIDGLVHCANAKGVMGAGIAKQLADTYPSVLRSYQADLKAWQGGKSNPELALGKVSFQSCHQVFSIIGQLNIGRDQRHVDYGAIASGLSQIIHSTSGKFKLGIPKYMGCGLAGGDWTIMSEIIYGLFRNVSNIDVYIIEYKQQA